MKNKIYKKMRILWFRLRMASVQHKLMSSRESRRQLLRFKKSGVAFNQEYKDLLLKNSQNITHPQWDNFVRRIEDAVLPVPSMDFLRHRVFRETMVAAGKGPLFEETMATLRDVWDEGQLRRILEEDAVGSPRIMNREYMTSYNAINQAFHIANWSKVSGKTLADIQTIIEWGGGYGSFARIVRTIRPITHVILDIPIMIMMQKLYLSSIYGGDAVNLIDAPDKVIKKGVINLMPAGLIDDYDLSCDMFFSTSGLSETPAVIQDKVFARNWFGAKHLILSYQRKNSDFPDADRIDEHVRKTGAYIRRVISHDYAVL